MAFGIGILLSKYIASYLLKFVNPGYATDKKAKKITGLSKENLKLCKFFVIYSIYSNFYKWKKRRKNDWRKN